MTATAPRWRGFSPAERRTEMQKVSDGQRRRALDRRIDDLVAGARLLSDEQKTRLAVLLMQAGGGGE
jgi:hypothetical protein